VLVNETMKEDDEESDIPEISIDPQRPPRGGFLH